MKNKYPRIFNFLKKAYLVLNAFKTELFKKIVKVFSLNKYLSSIYYVLFSRAMSRETFAVLHGKRMYYEGYTGSYFCLVRNIHRLEKALCMPDRRPVFAKDYIKETVASYDKLVANSPDIESIQSQLLWATDVLDEYFSVIAYDHQIENARSLYNATRKAESEKGLRCIPYQRKNLAKSHISFEEFLILSQQRRSVRWYEKKLVDRALLDKAVLAASLSPSACNRQPFEFRIYDDPSLVNEVINIPMGTAGWSHQPPVIVAVIGQLRAYFSERDRHIIYIDGSLASMSFMYALETLGLSSCPINFPDIADREAKAKNVMKLMHDERVIMMIAVGFADPDGFIPYSQKKSLDQLRSYNKSC